MPVILIATGVLSGCFLQLPEPTVTMEVAPYVDSSLVLIPITFQGEGAVNYGRYTLCEWDTATQSYRLRQTRDIDVESGYSSILNFELPDNRYRLTFSVLSVRDGTFTPVPYLTVERPFVVDTQVPSNDFKPNPGPGVYAADQWVRLNHDELSGTSGSPVTISYTIDSDGTNDAMPPDNAEVYRPSQEIFVPLTPGTTVYLNVIAIDEAGNRSEIRTYAYDF